ncbi:MAG: hypothetical protein ACXWQQ_07640 [Pseudobdellovibrio sp.]
MKNIKIVIMESPYDCWNEEAVGNFFKDIIGVKLRGYGREHAYGVLPVDGADLISTHLSVCRLENDGYLRPLMAIRWTSLQKCRLHFLNFPGMSLLQQAQQPEHVIALEKIIAELDKNNRDLFYSGSLSIDPLWKKDKAESLFLRELLTTMYVHYQRQKGYAELMAGGTVRFKIDQWLESIGHTPLHENIINVKHLAGEAVRVMHLRDFSFEALRIAKKWEHLWDERMIIGNTAAASKVIKQTG